MVKGLNEGGYDAVGWIPFEAQLKLLMFLRNLGEAYLIFQNLRWKERMSKHCVFRDGIYFSMLFFFSSGNRHFRSCVWMKYLWCWSSGLVFFICGVLCVGIMCGIVS